MKNGEIYNLKFTFLNLTKTLGSKPVVEFNEYSAENDLKLESVTPEGIKFFFEDMKRSSSHYSAWREYRTGYGKHEKNGDAIFQKMGILEPQNPNSKYFCFTSHLL